MSIKPWTMYFYPRPPRGGRLGARKECVEAAIFLSTPSARRATRRPRCRCRPAANFYPRPPRGGRLRILNNFNNVELFLSTPSARRATHRIQVQLRQLPISIHALREEGDPLQILGPGLQIQFLSTPSARRATPTSTAPAPGTSNFYPRPPRGGRLARPLHPGVPQRFLSTPSARRATVLIRCITGVVGISIHALREEGDLQC